METTIEGEEDETNETSICFSRLFIQIPLLFERLPFFPALF